MIILIILNSIQLISNLNLQRSILNLINNNQLKNMENCQNKIQKKNITIN
jgi:hypothetical protein